MQEAAEKLLVVLEMQKQKHGLRKKPLTHLFQQGCQETFPEGPFYLPVLCWGSSSKSK